MWQPTGKASRSWEPQWVTLTSSLATSVGFWTIRTLVWLILLHCAPSTRSDASALGGWPNLHIIMTNRSGIVLATFCNWIHETRKLAESSRLCPSRWEASDCAAPAEASWADCLAMIRQRHPEVAAQLVDQLEGFPDTPVLQAASTAATDHCMVSWVSNRFRGTHWQLESGPNRNQRNLRSGAKAGGNTRRRRGSRGGSAMSISSAGWMTQPSPCCDHRVALVLVWQCRRAPHVV